MSISNEQILEALSFVIEPDLGKDIVTLGLVSGIQIEGNKVSFTVQVNNPAMHSKKRMEEACLHQLQVRVSKEIEAVINIVPLPKNTERPPEQRKVLPGVKHVIAIASGKGGVGKSTITANLAVGLAQKGYKVGLVDADIYGPSMPIMFDVALEKPGVTADGKHMLPVENYGVKLLSIGFFAEIDQAIVWRGAMATKALTQLFNDADWGELDYMLVDLPPGTGDIHLTLVQQIPLSGVVIVSTPQLVALADARKGVNMFKLPSVNVPVLGIVENMAWFTPEELPENKYYIFGKDGAKSLSEEMNIPLIAQIPLVQSIREAGDVGRPAIMQGNTLQAKAFQQLVEKFVPLVEKKEAVM